MKQSDWDMEVHGAIKNFLMNQRLASKYVPRESFVGGISMIIGDDDLSKHVLSVNKRWVSVSDCKMVPGATYGELLEPGSSADTARVVLRAFEDLRALEEQEEQVEEATRK